MAKKFDVKDKDIPADTCWARDQRLRPLTRVHLHKIVPDEPFERLISMPPREAVAWCVATQASDPSNWPNLVQYVQHENGCWTLGNFYA